MNFKSAIMYLLCGLLCVGCSSHGESRSEARSNGVPLVDTQRNAFVVHNLFYVEKHPSLSQTLDLYVPALEKGPFPVIIWLHGGAWMHGDKAQDCVPCDHMLGKYAVASVNYRLDTEAPFPAQIYDLKAAVRFLRAHAKQYKLDPDHILVWGSSAGGHLAALLGTSGGVKELEGSLGWPKYSSKVQAVCDWCGPSDLNTAQAQAGSNCKISYQGESSPVFVLMGGKMDKASLAKASPVTYVSKDDPPFLIMHGDIDDAVPPAQSQELYDTLKAAGVSADYRVLNGYGHWLGSSEHLQIVREFLDRNLQSTKQNKGG